MVQKPRFHMREDGFGGERPEMREYECEFYRISSPARSCFFCEHCHDIFFDYTNGPYMFFCELNEDEYEGAYGRCDGFREDGTDDD